MNEAGKTVDESPVTPTALVELLKLEDSNKISSKMGADIFRKMFVSSQGAKEIAAEAGEQISDEGALVDIVRTAIRDNPKAAEDFRRGKKQAAGFFVGQVMKSTQGRANPSLVSEILQRELPVQS